MTMRAEWLRGCATALVTPFSADGAVDEARMRALVERQIAGGVGVLVACGTTGEAAYCGSPSTVPAAARGCLPVWAPIRPP